MISIFFLGEANTAEATDQSTAFHRESRIEVSVTAQTRNLPDLMCIFN